jgi:hypothetical protein
MASHDLSPVCCVLNLLFLFQKISVRITHIIIIEDGTSPIEIREPIRRGSAEVNPPETKVRSGRELIVLFRHVDVEARKPKPEITYPGGAKSMGKRKRKSLGACAPELGLGSKAGAAENEPENARRVIN